MAHRYSAAIDGAANVAAGAAYAELIAGATKAISIRSINVTTKTAVGGSIALSRSFAIGTGTAAGIATGLPHRSTSAIPAATARLQSAWSSSPTGYTSKLRSTILPVATGQSRELWSEEDGPLVVEPGASLLLVNSGSGIDGGGLKVNVTWTEGPASDA